MPKSICMAQHHPTGSETTPPYAPRSSRFGSEPPSVEDDVDVWCYAILEVHARNDEGYTQLLHTENAQHDVSHCGNFYWKVKDYLLWRIAVELCSCDLSWKSVDKPRDVCLMSVFSKHRSMLRQLLHSWSMRPVELVVPIATRPRSSSWWLSAK